MRESGEEREKNHQSLLPPHNPGKRETNLSFADPATARASCVKRRRGERDDDKRNRKREKRKRTTFIV